MQEDREEESKIVCLYSKYDKFIVERLVGSAKAVEMVKEYCSNVSFIVWNGNKNVFFVCLYAEVLLIDFNDMFHQKVLSNLLTSHQIKAYQSSSNYQS